MKSKPKPEQTALQSAMALAAFGPCRRRPQDWIAVASPMIKHCAGMEDISIAALRIVSAEVIRLQKVEKTLTRMNQSLMRLRELTTDEQSRLKPKNVPEDPES